MVWLAGYTLLMTMFSFCTQYCRARSVYLCSPALVQPFSYLTVVLGIIFDVFIYGADYNLMMVAGMCLTSVGLFSKLILLKCMSNHD